jgi:exonuclease SbcC
VIEVDETYTPRLKETGYWRDPSSLSGGERTLLALAYKIGTGQLIMGLRGMALDFLVLDEPTESLGPEDKSIERVAEAISRLKSIEFVITITHAEEFSKYADHVIRMVNEGSRSVVSYGG